MYAQVDIKRPPPRCCTSRKGTAYNWPQNSPYTPHKTDQRHILSPLLIRRSHGEEIEDPDGHKDSVTFLSKDRVGENEKGDKPNINPRPSQSRNHPSHDQRIHVGRSTTQRRASFEDYHAGDKHPFQIKDGVKCGAVVCQLLCSKFLCSKFKWKL